MAPKNRFIVVVNSWDTRNVLAYINRLLVKYRVNGRVQVLRRNVHRACIYVIANAGRMYSVLFVGDLFSQAKKDGFYCGQLTEYDDEEIIAEEIIRVRDKRFIKWHRCLTHNSAVREPPILSLMLLIAFIFVIITMLVR